VRDLERNGEQEQKTEETKKKRKTKDEYVTESVANLALTTSILRRE